MKRHSPESKKNKCKRQKVKRRLQFNSSIRQQSDVSSIAETPECEPSANSYESDHDQQFLDALDRAADESQKYWTRYQAYLESYKDVHPAIVCSEKNDVEVYVRGGHKGMSGLNRVAVSEYFSSAHEREQNSQQMCKILRNRVDQLESLLENAKLEREKQKREHGKEKEQIRYFWRNKIFEEGSWGGRMIMAAVQKN